MSAPKRLSLPPRPSLPAPRRLAAACAELASRVGDLASSEARDDEMKQAQAWLRRHLRHEPCPALDRRLIRGLLGLLGQKHEIPLPALRSQLVEAILAAPTLSLRLAWRLWTQDEASRLLSAAWLEATLTNHRAHGDKLPGWLPRWLPPEGAQLTAALHQPEPFIFGWCRAHEPRLDALREAVAVPLSGAFFDSLVHELIAHGSDSWWKAHDPDWLRSWSAQHSARMAAAVGDRQLCALGGAASGPHELPQNAESRALHDWLMEQFGDPREHEALWEDFSKTALRVARWLCVRASFERILALFARDAQRDRVAFWRPYLPALRDAVYYEAKDGPVCLMLVRDYLVVEFGKTGNACYFYEAPRTRTEGGLPRHTFPAGLRCEDFKHLYGTLEIGGVRFPYVDKMNHSFYWPDRFPELVGPAPR